MVPASAFSSCWDAAAAGDAKAEAIRNAITRRRIKTLPYFRVFVSRRVKMGQSNSGCPGKPTG